jgi:predicted lipoprotein
MLAAVTTVTGCTKVPGVYVAEKEGAQSASGAGGPFNPNAFVEGIWDEKVLPTVTEKAVDAKPLLAAIAADAESAKKQYGKTSAAGGATSFLIKGEGKVLEHTDATGAGQLTVDLAPGDGKPDVALAVGPVFLGTAIRDAVGFIDFGQFTNQIDFQGVSTALNRKSKDTVIGKHDVAALPGKTVKFDGAFQLADPSRIVVTPVHLEVTS